MRSDFLKGTTLSPLIMIPLLSFAALIIIFGYMEYKKRLLKKWRREDWQEKNSLSRQNSNPADYKIEINDVGGVESNMKKNVRSLSDEEINLMVNNVKASLAVEELYVTEKESEVYRKYLKGDLTEDEVLKLFQNKGGGEN